MLHVVKCRPDPLSATLPRAGLPFRLVPDSRHEISPLSTRAKYTFFFILRTHNKEMLLCCFVAHRKKSDRIPLPAVCEVSGCCSVHDVPPLSSAPFRGSDHAINVTTLGNSLLIFFFLPSFRRQIIFYSVLLHIAFGRPISTFRQYLEWCFVTRAVLVQVVFWFACRPSRALDVTTFLPLQKEEQVCCTSQDSSVPMMFAV